MTQEPRLSPLTELAADSGWEERLAQCPAAEAAARVRQADALTSGSPAERRIALLAYRALEAAIDPTTPSGCDRTEWILNALQEIDMAFEPLLRRAAEGGERTVVRRRAGVALGAFRVADGDQSGGESWFLRVLAESRGLGGIPERGACLNLCRLYVRQKRVFEAYVMARHAIRLFREAADPLRVMLSLTEVMGALYEMREWDAFYEAAEDSDDLVPTLPADFVERSIHSVLEIKLRALRARGELDAALALLDAHPARRRATTQPWHTVWWRAGVRAAILSDQGRLDEARALFETARRTVPPKEPFRWVILQSQAICAARSGDDALARRATREILDAGRESLVRTAGTGATLRLLSGLATALAEHGHEELSWEAYDQAAVVALERIQEARRAVHNLPELEFVTDEDRTLLARARKRFAAEHAELLKSLALVLRRKDVTGEHWLHEFRDGRYAVVCAWCAQVKDSDGTWIPIGHFLPPAGPLNLTHGMCEACAQEWRTEIAARA